MYEITTLVHPLMDFVCSPEIRFKDDFFFHIKIFPFLLLNVVLLLKNRLYDVIKFYYNLISPLKKKKYEKRKGNYMKSLDKIILHKYLKVKEKATLYTRFRNPSITTTIPVLTHLETV